MVYNSFVSSCPFNNFLCNGSCMGEISKCGLNGLRTENLSDHNPNVAEESRIGLTRNYGMFDSGFDERSVPYEQSLDHLGSAGYDSIKESGLYKLVNPTMDSDGTSKFGYEASGDSGKEYMSC